MQFHDIKSKAGRQKCNRTISKYYSKIWKKVINIVNEEAIDKDEQSF